LALVLVQNIVDDFISGIILLNARSAERLDELALRWGMCGVTSLCSTRIETFDACRCHRCRTPRFDPAIGDQLVMATALDALSGYGTDARMGLSICVKSRRAHPMWYEPRPAVMFIGGADGLDFQIRHSA
jgi:hypothetical protein